MDSQPISEWRKIFWDLDWCREVFESAHSGAVPLVFATPGVERQDSVYNGFQVRALLQGVGRTPRQRVHRTQSEGERLGYRV